MPNWNENVRVFLNVFISLFVFCYCIFIYVFFYRTFTQKSNSTHLRASFMPVKVH